MKPKTMGTEQYPVTDAPYHEANGGDRGDLLEARGRSRELERERNILRRIAGQACLRVAGLEIIVAKLRGKGRSKRR